MSANQANFPISNMARVLSVSKAGFYAWLQRPASAHAQADAALLQRIRTVHATSRETYGAPRVHAELRAGGEKHGPKRIARLMRDAGLVGASRRRHGPITTRCCVIRSIVTTESGGFCEVAGLGSRLQHAGSRPH